LRALEELYIKSELMKKLYNVSSQGQIKTEMDE